MKEDASFKASLLLPQTDFPMKADLSKKEPELIKGWHKKNIYQKLQDHKKKSKKFFLLDGPPYANGDLHLGHVLNKVLKDIVVKYKNLQGFQCPFIPTWDCHGLPIELSALKKIKDQAKLSSQHIRETSRQEASHWVDRQKEAFRRLGVLARFDEPVLTMDASYEAEEVRVLARLIEKKLFERGKKPVLWCFKLQTALAFSEAEYREHKSPSIYVKFPLTSSSQEGLALKHPVHFVIWTTTPWTLPANQAVCVNASLEYGVYRHEQDRYVLAKGLKESVEQDLGIQGLKLEKTLKGRELEGLKVHHPFLSIQVPVILGEHVTLEAGTGCVHTAPGHGLEDYHVGKKYSLSEICPVDERGHFVDSVPENLRGVFIYKGNKIILETLKKNQNLLGEKEVTHSYPYNPRSNSPLIYRLTPQWFLKLNDSKYPIRSEALKLIEKSIRFIPASSKVRLQSMLKNSPDWCLSRQRSWGIPIVVFYCQECDLPYLDTKVVMKIADKMQETNMGIDYYFNNSVKELLGEATCSKCGCKEFKKGRDILDVWFDSGIEHAVFQKEEQASFPADLFLEGSDQHRGWFQTSLISSLALNKQAPFKTLLTHGFVNDKRGHKMSKSKGNIISPTEVIDKRGAEILRMWVASEDYSQDINASDEIFQRVSETYRRFRNTFRFILGNIHDFNPEKDSCKFQELSPVDKWTLIQLRQLTEASNQAYEDFSFHKVYHLLNKFFTVTLSSFYLDIIKDRLYTFSKQSRSRRQAQTTIYHLIDQLVVLMAPITSFLSEETYAYLPKASEESVFLENFSKVEKSWQDPELEKLFEFLFPLRENLNKQMEELRAQRTIGSSLQVEACLQAPPWFFEHKLTEFELCEFFSVSKVVCKPGKLPSIKAQKIQGKKCLRCWFYTQNLLEGEICSKCAKNLDQKPSIQ